MLKMSTPVIVIAALNEEQYIGQVVREARKYGQVIVVDDGSTDKTASVVKKNKGLVISHKKNKGKGAAMRTGADYALSLGADLLVFMDGDSQHEASAIPTFLKALEKHDIVFGARKRDKNMPFLYRFGNWFLSTCVRVLFGLRIHDSQGGFRAMTAETYKKIRWESNRYGVETEMIAHTRTYQLKYTEVPIKTIYIDRYKGTTPLDGFPIVWNMIKWRFRK